MLFPEAVVSIAAGQGFSAAATLSGRVYTWGRGKYGALGSGRVEDRSTPSAVPGIADAIQVTLLKGLMQAAVKEHSYCIDSLWVTW